MNSARQFSRTAWAAWIGGAILFLTALIANTRHNDFPIGYHYDEPAKVEQITSGQFRLNQPALMLEVANAVANARGKLAEPQAVGESGRWLSAIYVAAAITILAGLAWRVAGLRAAIFAAMLLLPQRQLILAAHYFKEDAILLFGLAVAWAALFAFLKKPDSRRAVFLGAACALALSAKFIGALMLIPVAFALGLRSVMGAEAKNGWRTTASFLAGLIVAAAVMNLRALLHPEVFAAAFSAQWNAVAHGNHGVGGSLPNWRNLGMCFLEVAPVVILLNAIFIVRLVRKGGELRIWLLALFPVMYALALLFSAIEAVRYALPVAAFAAIVAALALEQLFLDARKIASARRWCFAGCVALAGIAAGWELWRGAEVWRGFAHDSRKAMAEFIAAMPHPPACIAEDALVKLGGAPSLAVPAKVLSANYAADLGTLEQLRRQGVTHVAICRLAYRQYFETGKMRQASAQADYERRKEFYETVKKEKCLFAEPMGRPDILQPGLELYDIEVTNSASR